MSTRSDTVDLLFVDADAARHASYRDLVADLASEVTTVTPEGVPKALSGRRYAALFVNLEGLEAQAGDAVLVGVTSAVADAATMPIVLIAPDVSSYKALFTRAAGTFDFLPVPLVSELLRSKVAMLADLARTRDQLARCEATLGVLTRQVHDQIHRTKNLLAIMQSIALRTVIDGREIAAAREVLVGRLRALSRAYQLVVAADGKGTDLADLFETQLGNVAHRIHTSGPPVRLSGSVVHTLALAIHELADNAQRHGALRAPHGSADVGWTYFERGAERYLEIAWTESGSSPVMAPPHYGFGLALVSSFAGSGASPNVRFDDGRLSCRMRLDHDVLMTV